VPMQRGAATRVPVDLSQGFTEEASAEVNGGSIPSAANSARIDQFCHH
jgi:hypothetical protein